MTVFNRATLIISRAAKTAAAVKLPTTADEILKLHPAGEPAKPAIASPAKTSADGPVTPEELAAYRMTNKTVELPEHPYAGALMFGSQGGMTGPTIPGTPGAVTKIPPMTAKEVLDRNLADKQKAFGPQGPAPKALTPSAPAPLPGQDSSDYSTPLADKAAMRGHDLMDSARHMGDQYVQAMKDFNPYAIGGTALAAGGTVALLHHLLSGKKSKKTAAQLPAVRPAALSTAVHRPPVSPVIRDAEFSVHPDPVLSAPAKAPAGPSMMERLKGYAKDRPVATAGIALAPAAALTTAHFMANDTGAGNAPSAAGSTGPVTDAEKAAFRASQATNPGHPAPKDPSLLDKTKQTGSDALDWVKNNPGTAALAAGGTLGGAALLHHLMSKRTRRDEE